MEPIKITCGCGGTMDLRGAKLSHRVNIQNFICSECGNKLAVVEYNKDMYEGFSVLLKKGDEYETRQAGIDLIENVMKKAGFEWDKKYLIVNSYCPPDTEQNPWHLFSTKYGNIIVGKRYRVWTIDWEDTGKSMDDIVEECSSDTQWKHGFHAWTEESLIDRLSKLKLRLNNE